tara:strand:- start:2783 stop:3499 length:717 start_codon:yes stop_codon:yes gene_type:complete
VGVVMRGTDETSGALFSYVDLEERIPPRHPLRKIRQVVNDALSSLDAEFEALYTDFGRPSIPPERLIRASLLQILFSVRSERQLMEQMDYNLMFRWFVGLGIDDPVWVPTVFTKNRDRLLSTEMSRKVMAAILAHREVAPLLSDEHFSVDGTLVKAWASMKGFQPKADAAPPDDEGPRSSTKLVYICGLSALLIESSQWVNDIQGPKFCSHTPTAVSVCLDGSAGIFCRYVCSDQQKR